MWILTPIGFYSIVQKYDDAKNGRLTIRARARKDLENLHQYPLLEEMSDIVESDDSDYRFRATAKKEDVADAIARLVAHIDYGNFKNKVTEEQGYERASLYTAVWQILSEIQQNND